MAVFEGHQLVPLVDCQWTGHWIQPNRPCSPTVLTDLLWVGSETGMSAVAREALFRRKRHTLARPSPVVLGGSLLRPPWKPLDLVTGCLLMYWAHSGSVKQPPLGPDESALNQPKPHPSSKPGRGCSGISDDRLKTNHLKNPNWKALEAAKALTSWDLTWCEARNFWKESS